VKQLLEVTQPVKVAKPKFKRGLFDSKHTLFISFYISKYVIIKATDNISIFQGRMF